MNKQEIQAVAMQTYPEPLLGPQKRMAFLSGALWMQQNQSGMRWVNGDYERLWQWANNPKRKRPIPMYVDYKWDKDSPAIRDICHLRDVKHGFGARGIGYSSYSIYLPDDTSYAHEGFLSDCTALNIEWLDESLP